MKSWLVVPMVAVLLVVGCYMRSPVTYHQVACCDLCDLMAMFTAYDCVTGEKVSHITNPTYQLDFFEIGNEKVYVWGLLSTSQLSTRVSMAVRKMAASEQVWRIVDVVPVAPLEGMDSVSFWLTWDLRDQVYSSGVYQVEIVDDSAATQLSTFKCMVDNSAPCGWIEFVNNSAVVTDTFFRVSCDDLTRGTAAGFWVEWSDGLTPDDSVQAHNQVQLWCKPIDQPNQPSSWQPFGYQSSSCNPHWVTADNRLAAVGDSLCVVATVMDEWGNGSLDAVAAMKAFAAGRYVCVVIDITG